jgi:beta-glucosidase
VEWSYRRGTGKPMDYRLEMGLWSLEEDADGSLLRVKNPAADNFLRLANAGRAASE